MKNEFKKLVDRELSGLCWDERMRQCVLHFVQKEEKPVKRKLMAGMVFAMILALLVSFALATGLMFSQRYDVVKLADEAMLDAYGVTDELQALFSKRVVLDEEQTTVYYHGLEDFSGILGHYTVTVSKGKAAAEWSFDDQPNVGWNAEKLAAVMEGCKQDGGYGQAVMEARSAAETAGLEAMEKFVTYSEEETHAAEEKQALSEQEVQNMALLTVEEMDKLARQAIRQRFGLNDDQIEKLELVEESCIWMMENGRPIYPAYYWLSQTEDGWSKGDGIYIVNVDVQTGVVDQITYDVGLFGNG